MEFQADFSWIYKSCPNLLKPLSHKNNIVHVIRHLTQEGLPATRDSLLNDIDDTAMGFRLLRLHGYCVSACT
jgi:hypothetical protein